MTKIKNFRVSLRPREMVRWLKKERGMETTPDLELTVEQMAKEAKNWIAPAAVYTTLTRQTAEKTARLPFPEKAVAVSVVAVSIGPAVAVRREAAAADPTREPLLAALEQEALAQSLQFAFRLIHDQAKEEDCDMSPPVSLQETHVTSSLATLLGVARIGISLADSASGLPSYARLSCLFWTPLGKGSARRAEPTGRAEKVAA